MTRPLAPPAAALAAYVAGRRFHEELDAALLRAGARPLVDFAHLAERSRGGALAEEADVIARRLAARGVDPGAAVGALRDAASAPLPDGVAMAFWWAGLNGWPPPEEAHAWRRSPPPAARRRPPAAYGDGAVPVDGVEDPAPDSAHRRFWGDPRSVHWLRGWELRGLRGPRGERLLVGAVKAGAPRYRR